MFMLLDQINNVRTETFDLTKKSFKQIVFIFELVRRGWKVEKVEYEDGDSLEIELEIPKKALVVLTKQDEK